MTTDLSTHSRGIFRPVTVAREKISCYGAAFRFVVMNLCTLFWVAFMQSPIGFASDSLTEPEIKSAILFNFLKFTEWPACAFKSSESPLIVGITGSDPFGRILDDMVKGEFINGRSISVKRFQAADDISACHVLFVSRSEKNRLTALFDVLKKKPILTVSEIDRFCEKGGMINLTLSSSGTIKPEINPDASQYAGLRISSKLLTLPMVRLIKSEH